MQPRIVIVGGGYAGVLATLRAARSARGRAHVELVSERPELVERIRLHEHVARSRPVTHAIQHLIRDTGATLTIARALGVEPDRGVVRTSRGAVPFDALVVATGSATDRSSAPGVAEHAHSIEWGHAGATASVIQTAKPGASILVVGGGLTGIEVASEIAEAHPHLRVKLATRSRVDPRLSERACAEIRRSLAELGVVLLEHTAVDGLEPGAAATSRGAVRFDACIWTNGLRAAPLLAESGFDVDDRGRAWVDPTLRAVTLDRIFVAGDASRPVMAPGCVVWMGCKTAMPLGAQAAENAVAAVLGAPLRPMDFRDGGYCISVGRRRGVIQRTDRDGAVVEKILRGRLAAFLKESICRFTVRSLRAERSGLFKYRWLRTRRAPAALPAARLVEEQ